MQAWDIQIEGFDANFSIIENSDLNQIKNWVLVNLNSINHLLSCDRSFKICDAISYSFISPSCMLHAHSTFSLQHGLSLLQHYYKSTWSFSNFERTWNEPLK